METINVSSLLTPALKDLRQVFQSHGFDIRLVGGCVRDLVNNVVPKDIDLCTDASPTEQIVIYAQSGYRYVETGIDHGTITVVIDNNTYEITSLRVDEDTNGRHATVSYTRDWYEDCARRDLRFNAMIADFDGNLIDPFNGVNDLKNGIVKFVGNPRQRMQEDYLRILRWIRFNAIYGTQQDNETRIAVMDMASGLQQVSRERIWQEIKKIISAKKFSTAIRDIVDLNILSHIDLPKTLNNESIAVSVIENTIITPSPVTIITMWIQDYVTTLADIWKWSKQEKQLAEFIIREINNPSSLRVIQVMSGASREWITELAIAKLSAMMITETELIEIQEWNMPIFPITGFDLIATGIKPGPAIRDHLHRMKFEWAISNFIKTRDELMLSLKDI